MRLFEGWKALDWFYFFISYVVSYGLARFLMKYVGISKDWVLAVFLIPIAIFPFIHQRGIPGDGEDGGSGEEKESFDSESYITGGYK